MNKDSTPDEQPKAELAKKVVTSKRKYFFPDHNTTVEAEDSVEAEKLLKKRKATTDEEVTDGQ